LKIHLLPIIFLVTTRDSVGKNVKNRKKIFRILRKKGIGFFGRGGGGGSMRVVNFMRKSESCRGTH